MCCKKEVILIDKEELKDFVKNLIESAYSLGLNGNTNAKNSLKESIEHLPLVSAKTE